MTNFVDAVVVTAVLLLCSGCDAFSPKTICQKVTLINDAKVNSIHQISSAPSRSSRRNFYKNQMVADGDFPLGENKGNDNNNDNKAGRFPYSPDVTDNTFKTVATYNWKYGLCAHKVVFEATETIKKMRFCGDLLGAFSRKFAEFF
jgi:hypothetical protein